MGLFKRTRSEGRQPNTQQSHFGPHFEKGPHQEEIFDRRAGGERFPQGHPELRGRAHSFHPPIRQHTYTEPYEKVPQPWTNQMKTEHYHYKALSAGSDSTTKHKKNVNTAKGVKVGTGHTPTKAQRDVIQKGIESADATRKLANR